MKAVVLLSQSSALLVLQLPTLGLSTFSSSISQVANSALDWSHKYNFALVLSETIDLSVRVYATQNSLGANAIAYLTYRAYRYECETK